MALINCPECKNMISEYAAFCVHCGYPLNPVSKTESIIQEKKECGAEVNSEASVPIMQTLREAAKETGISYDCLRKMCLRKKVAYVKAGSKYLVNRNSLHEYLSKGE